MIFKNVTNLFEFNQALARNNFMREVFHLKLKEGYHYLTRTHIPMGSVSNRMEMLPTDRLTAPDIIQLMDGLNPHYLPALVMTNTNPGRARDNQVIFDFKRHWLNKLMVQLNQQSVHTADQGRQVITGHNDIHNRANYFRLHQDYIDTVALNVFDKRKIRGGYHVIEDTHAHTLQQQHLGNLGTIDPDQTPPSFVRTLNKLEHNRDMPIVAIRDFLTRHGVSPVEVIMPNGKRVPKQLVTGVEADNPSLADLPYGYYQRLMHFGGIKLNK